MTDHTMTVHFKVSSDMSTEPKPDTAHDQIISAMAAAIGGHPAMAEFEARKIYRAVMAMHSAISEVQK